MYFALGSNKTWMVKLRKFNNNHFIKLYIKLKNHKDLEHKYSRDTQIKGQKIEYWEFFKQTY